MLLFGCFLVLDLWIYNFFPSICFIICLQLQFGIHSKFLLGLLVKAVLVPQISSLNTQITLVILSTLAPPPPSIKSSSGALCESCLGPGLPNCDL